MLLPLSAASAREPSFMLDAMAVAHFSPSSRSLLDLLLLDPLIAGARSFSWPCRVRWACILHGLLLATIASWLAGSIWRGGFTVRLQRATGPVCVEKKKWQPNETCSHELLFIVLGVGYRLGHILHSLYVFVAKSIDCPDKQRKGGWLIASCYKGRDHQACPAPIAKLEACGCYG